MATRQPYDHSVFLNIPFDVTYEPVFLAIIVSLVAIGRAPRCVLEIPSQGRNRLDRILQLMMDCKVSVHDLSRIGTPARFNMPFELGIAYALRTLKPESEHLFVILENKPHSLASVISDMRAYDPIAHENKPLRAISAVLDSLGPSKGFSAQEVHSLWKRLGRASRKLKREAGAKSVFTRTVFNKVVAAATEVVRSANTSL